ncbi:O-antigen ligase domain-containing protein [Methylobacterium sp. NEAU 140]|uniref:O-antigen ligase family protein n=1 Tax=Methylobacterium sp. NEAU 140 TaxID=3064945 RepID=UPI002735D924|nr:O-antigen ligase domain-containing protein [Methylobacterium sp. NEAU 140]MDP4025283.1 O-antigen ligase domain-containing protein [Methylobacterium sp. NEAU 140]
MLSVFVAIAILVWFGLLYGVARQRLVTVARPPDGPLAVPIALVATFAFMPLVFAVTRENSQALLDEGLSISNVLSLALAGLTGLYVAARAYRDPRLLRVPLSMPYLPFTLMIGVDGLSTLWSLVPSYTAYRTVELSIFYLASILIFDRSDIERRLADLLAAFVLIWLVAVSPTIGTSLAQGVVFSSAKNNMMPFVCAVLALLVVFDGRARRRALYFVLAVAGFVVAGSAASTGALVGVVPGVMIASGHRPVRVLGIVATLATIVVFLVLMLSISMFPELLDAVSAILQKPTEELANGTGRNNFWPIFLEATRDRLIGSGFSAGDRFLDLLLSVESRSGVASTQSVGLASAHNMFLSAWAGLGLIGICFAVTVLWNAVRWGLKLELTGRRFVISSVLVLVLNGMTTPGIFQDWNVNTLGFLAVLAYARVGALRRSAHAVWTRRTVAPAAGPAAAAGWRTV